MEAEVELVRRLAVGLGLGLVVGVERGWSTRSVESGMRGLGMRSFGLAGLLGAVVGSLASGGEPRLVGLAFVGLAVVTAFVYAQASRASGDYGATTELALLLVFSLGVLAASGHELEAAGAAMGTALLLGSKTRLHAFVEALDERELSAALQLAVAAVVVLPLLPDRDFGPYQALNLRSFGWLSLLIAGLSFGGYVAVRLWGPRRGTFVTALLGGLTSSTAVTVAFARAARAQPAAVRVLAAGIGISCAVMALRLGFVAAIVAPELSMSLAPPLLALAAVPMLAAALLARGTDSVDGSAVPLSNPLQLEFALLWAGVIALLSVLARALHELAGAKGLYFLAATSGLVDVDPIGLSLARMVPQPLSAGVAASAILCAALANTLAKAALAGILGGPRLGRIIAAILLPAFCLAALVGLWL